jgi:hypothetical protein
MESWAVGYLSGIAHQSGSDYMLGLNVEAIYAWLDNYCSAHPLDHLDDALDALAAERGVRQ